MKILIHIIKFMIIGLKEVADPSFANFSGLRPPKLLAWAGTKIMAMDKPIWTPHKNLGALDSKSKIINTS